MRKLAEIHEDSERLIRYCSLSRWWRFLSLARCLLMMPVSDVQGSLATRQAAHTLRTRLIMLDLNHLGHTGLRDGLRRNEREYLEVDLEQSGVGSRRPVWSLLIVLRNILAARQGLRR